MNDHISRCAATNCFRARNSLTVMLIAAAMVPPAFCAQQHLADTTVDAAATSDARRSTAFMDEGQRRVSEALDAPVTLNFTGTLRDFAHTVEAAAGVRVILDENALGDKATSGRSVNATVQKAPLREALQATLDQVGATYAVREGVLLLTSRDAAEQYLLTRVYYVGDLVLRRPPARDARWWRSATQPFAPRGPGALRLSNRELDSWIELIDLISGTVEPELWDDVGGPGAIEPFPWRGAMVITNSEAVHHQVAQLIETLRKIPVRMRDVAAADLDRGYALSRHSEAHEAIRRALEQPAMLDLGETTLVEVAAAIESRYGIQVVLHPSILEGEGADVAVQADFSGIALRSGLRLMLSNFSASYVIRNESLYICTEDAAEEMLEVRLYPVRDLVLPAGKPIEEADFDSLIDLIETVVEPQSWDSVGGPSSIGLFPLRPCLVIAQTDAVHNQIAWLLAALRAILAADVSVQATGTEPHRVEAGPSYRAIRQALDKPAVVQCRETPLDEVIARLELQHGVRFAFDTSIADTVGTDVPVTGEYDNISLGAALKLLLAQVDATYQIRHETVVLMTKSQAEIDLTMVVYPVADLVYAARIAAPVPAYADFDSLIDLIETTIEPHSWDSVGGPGSIEPFTLRPCLAVMQTGAVHDQIESLLMRLRTIPVPRSTAAGLHEATTR